MPGARPCLERLLVRLAQLPPGYDHLQTLVPNQGVMVGCALRIGRICRCAAKSPSAKAGSNQSVHTKVNEQDDPKKEHADAIADCVSRERMRAWEIEPGGLGISLPSVPYWDAKNVSNGMSAFPRSLAEATSPQKRCGKQR